MAKIRILFDKSETFEAILEIGKDITEEQAAELKEFDGCDIGGYDDDSVLFDQFARTKNLYEALGIKNIQIENINE